MNVIALLSGTIIILIFSWLLSVRYKRYHGIARFFSFESTYILFLLNYKAWFIDPLSWNQIISWIMLILSAYIVIAGYTMLKRKGKPDNNFENTSVLVKTGIYGLIRHPLYLSVFLLGTGIMFKYPDKIQILLGIINIIALYFTALIEENEMILKFGDEYKLYIKETKMFIPFIL
jgi:protein-S-isoprenylcysteine O-methyltransferase Ste14